MLHKRMTITTLNHAYQSVLILHMYMYNYVGLPHILLSHYTKLVSYIANWLHVN